MTESAGNFPKNSKCNFVDSEPLYDTMEEALIVYNNKLNAPSEKPQENSSSVDSPSSADAAAAKKLND